LQGRKRFFLVGRVEGQNRFATVQRLKSGIPRCEGLVAIAGDVARRSRPRGHDEGPQTRADGPVPLLSIDDCLVVRISSLLELCQHILQFVGLHGADAIPRSVGSTPIPTLRTARLGVGRNAPATFMGTLHGATVTWKDASHKIPCHLLGANVADAA